MQDRRSTGAAAGMWSVHPCDVKLHLNVREDRSQRQRYTEVQNATPNSRDCADYEHLWRPTVSKRAAHHASVPPSTANIGHGAIG